MNSLIKIELLETAKRITNSMSYKDIRSIDVEVENWDDELKTVRAQINIEYVDMGK